MRYWYVSSRTCVTFDLINAELTNAGYDAILDMNDKKYGGYDTKSPLIVFNGAKKAVIKSVRQVGGTELSKAFNSETAKLTARQHVKAYAKTNLPYMLAGAGISGAIKAATAYKTSQMRNKIVADYKREHPGTKLSYDQILDNYYSSK